MQNQWKIFEEMIEDLKYDLSRAQNDPEIGPLRQIFNKPLKAAQVDMSTKTDVKPIDFVFLENYQ